ncbi:excalibur calcium-binding protein [Streptomyces zaomyceticus]|uniref:excalibur calcium-binding protein n=1 Tax=Streptomyces zaomyceticus TaxID=68286 RepID=UPI00371EFDF4
MSSRSVVAGITLALVSIAPLSGVAHAQDLDCSDFRYQEDAQAEFNRDTSDPNRLDEDQGIDDNIACERLPRRSDAAVVPVNPSPTAVPSPAPVAPSAVPVAPAPVVPAPVMPSLGTRAGIGGSSGPSDLSIAMGLTLAIGATSAGGYLTARRLARGSKRS